jgi:hypothetical protein
MNKNKIFDLKQFSLVELNKEQQAKTQGGGFWVAFGIVGGIIGIYTAAYSYADAKISKWK